MENYIVRRIFDFVALIKYNGEKRDFLEKALKKFLLDPKKDFNIEEEIKKIYEDKPRSKKSEIKKDLNNIFSLEDQFEMQDYILTIDVNPEDLIYYISEKYSIYNDRLKSEIGVGVSDIIKFSIVLRSIYYSDLQVQNYQFNPNIFSSKEELYYPYNLQYPDEVSKKCSEMASLLDKEALILFLEKSNIVEDVKPLLENIETLLNLLSFRQEDLTEDNKLRFQDKPLLKLDDGTFIILNDVHLLYGLQSRLDSLLNNYKWYTEKKGKRFEKVTFNILEEINKNERIDGKFQNTVYYHVDNNRCELDGLINFQKFSWFVELKGRIPRTASFKGDEGSVKEDIKIGVTEAEKQALRAIKESEENGEIGGIKVNDKKGILIITEGVYPNLNSNPITSFPRKDEKYPRYVINLLTLMEILRQRDIYYFDKFLEWRCDPKMPLYCMSELDYWDYFTKMQGGLDKKECYDLAIKNQNKIIYNGSRFNAPKFIKGE